MKKNNRIKSLISGYLYRGKLSASRYLPNKDNLPYVLLNDRIVDSRVEAERHDVKDRRLVFVISTGRAGSEYLARLFNTAANVYAIHEPRPRMNGRYLEMAMNAPLADSYYKRRIKILGINRALSRMDKDSIYVETSHMFIKSFHDVVLDYYDNVEVIILRRPLYKILKSFVELGFFAESNPTSRRWFHLPGSRNSKAELFKPLAEMDQFEKCIAYLLDIEAFAQEFTIKYPNVKTHEVQLEDVGSVEGARRFFEGLRAEWTDESEKLCSDVVNKKVAYKSALDKLVSEEVCRERLHQYIEQARIAGKWIPDIQLT